MWGQHLSTYSIPSEQCARVLPAHRHIHMGSLVSMFVFCVSEMTCMMKKERAFWASVCLLLSVAPELLNALPEKVEHSETTGKWCKVDLLFCFGLFAKTQFRIKFLFFIMLEILIS